MKSSGLARKLSIFAQLCLYLHCSRAELHHQRPLPRPSASIEAAEAISLHANASRATFAIGDHLISWLVEHPSQHATRRKVDDVTKEDVVFIVMVRLISRDKQSGRQHRPKWPTQLLEQFAHASPCLDCRRAMSGRPAFELKGPLGCVGPNTLLPSQM